MLTSYSTDNKEVTITCSVEELRLIAIHVAVAVGGPGLAQHLVEGVVNAAENTSNDSDYKDQADAFFDHVREEHTTDEGGKQIVEIMRSMAVAIPRQTVIAEHLRQMGKLGASESQEFSS